MRRRETGPVKETIPAITSVIVSNPYSPWLNGTTSPWHTPTAGARLRRWEVMYDEPLPYPPCNFKQCEHDTVSARWNFDVNGRERISHYSSDGTPEKQLMVFDHAYGFSLQGGHHMYNILDVPNSEIGPVFQIDNTDRFALTRLWDKVLPEIKPTLDVLVFIAEFRDVVDLFKSLCKKVSELVNAAVGLSQLVRDFGRYNGLLSKFIRGRSSPRTGLVRLAVDKSMTRLSNEWLEYNFALRPLASDLIGFLDALLSFNMKLQMLKAQAGTIQKIHRRITDEEWIPYEDLFVSECPVKQGQCAPNRCVFPNRDETHFESCTGGAVRKEFLTMHKTTRGLTVVYRYAWPKALDGLQGSIAALFSSIGLSPGLDTVWELIPFSFVVDWFLPLQSLFHQLENDPAAVKTEILDLCMTKRSSYAYNLVGRPLCPVNSNTTYARVAVDRFRRAVGADLLTRTPTFRWPNWMQISLGAALIKGRVRYRG